MSYLEKPSSGKKRPIKRPKSIVDFRLNTHGLHPHEPIGGSNRSISIEEGLYIWVTPEKHEYLHSTEDGEKENLKLKVKMQRAWIKKKIREGVDNPLDEWMKLFGTNYEVKYEQTFNNK